MVEQPPNAQALARNPVDVRWSDSTSDRADGGIAASSLFGLIADDLVRQYQVRTVADSQVLRVEFVLVGLFQQHVGVDHNAVADHVHRVRPTYTRRHKVKFERTCVVYYGVPGVVTTGVVCDDRSVFSKEINNLPFALVAPLGSDDGVCRHPCNSLVTRYRPVSRELTDRRICATGCYGQSISGMHGVFRRFMTVSLSPGASSRRSRDSTQASLDPLKMACINVSQRRYFRTGAENRQISVDWDQKYEVNFPLRPNAGRACWVSPAGMKNRRRAYIYNRTVDSAFSETR